MRISARRTSAQQRMSSAVKRQTRGPMHANQEVTGQQQRAELADRPGERVAIGVERRQLGLLLLDALVAPDQLDRS
ncbi:hypothetical protein [Streptomyces cinereoruber]|uniref:hypothetical protein n=1 Tax=Streptomyces cinereoruber TaxID=67260 RepID=UPI00363D644C